jgi:hypothetical protein
VRKQIKPPRHYGDVGPAIAEADCQPSTVQKDPEQSLALIFARLGGDYGGPLPRSGCSTCGGPA